MITRVQAGRTTIEGVSLGGIHTSLHVPELGVLLDVGLPLRRFASVDHVLLSHGHGDHAGGLAAWLGVRELLHRDKPPPRVFAPAEIVDDLAAMVDAARRLQRHDLSVSFVPMAIGDEVELRRDLHVRAMRTHHPVPSRGYQLFRRVHKLRPEHHGKPGHEIARLRALGEPMFDVEERLELAYATDTLVRVVDSHPEILRSRVLILECTFLDDRKRIEDSRAGGHVHLDELLEIADRFDNEHLVLMHFSLLYSPAEVHEILARRLPAALRDRTVAFAPEHGRWPG